VSLDDHVRRAVDRVLAEVRAPLDGTLRGLAGTIAIEARAVDVRFTAAMRLLDDALTLKDVLNTLADCVAGEVERSAVLIVAPGRLKGWRFSGFGGAAADPRTIEVLSTTGGLLGAVVHTKAMIVSLASTPRASAGDLPPFAQATDRRDAAVMPVVLGGTVAAAVYADAPSVGEESPSWVAAVNRLTRYAGLVLEARTARYLTGAPLDSPARGMAGGSRGASGGPR
jgi:hypothetical protein